MTEKRICGRVTSIKAVKREAPRLRAAISRFMSKLFRAALITIRTSGSARIECAITSPNMLLTILI